MHEHREDSRDSNGFPSVHVDALWEARYVETRSPDKLVDGSNVKVSDEVRFLFLNTMIKANTRLWNFDLGSFVTAASWCFSVSSGH